MRYEKPDLEMRILHLQRVYQSPFHVHQCSQTRKMEYKEDSKIQFLAKPKTRAEGYTRLEQ